MNVVDRINKIKCADRLQELYIELKWRISELEEHNQMLVELKNEEHENKEYHDRRCWRPGKSAGFQAAGPYAAAEGLRYQGIRSPRHEPAWRQRGYLCPLR